MDALIPGLLLRIKSPREHFVRIIDLIEGDYLFTYEIKESKRSLVVPEKRRCADIISGLQAGTIEVEFCDPFQIIPTLVDEDADPRDPKVVRRQEAEKKKERLQNRRFEIVSWIIERGGPDLFNKFNRRALIHAAVDEFKTDKTSIRRWLGMFWRGGMTPNALRPDYNNVGRPDESPTLKKSGINKGAGCKVNPKMLENIIEYFSKHPDGNLTLELHHEDFLEKYCSSGEELPDANGKVKIRLLPANQRIHLASFKYWYYKKTTEIDRLRRKYGLKEIGRNHRDLDGSIIASVYGPGSRYEVDFTVASNLLVSRYRRSQILGSPVVGVAWDVYSGAAVGLLVTWKNASSMQLRALIANTLCSKVAFCARYGITIKEEEWPMRHLPKLWVLDRGEGRGTVGDFLTKDFGWRWKNLPSLRPDLKPVVESGFAKIKKKTKWTPGWQPRMLKRGDDDRAIGAYMTIDEFTAHLIRILLQHNRTVSHKRPMSLPTVEMEEPANPINIWNNGIVSRSGDLRLERDENRVRALVLPSGKANIMLRGLEFQGITYNHPDLKNAKIRARRIGRKGSVPSVPIHYGETIDEIYYPVDDSKRKFLVCEATGMAAQFKGMAFEEYKLVKAGVRIRDSKNKDAEKEKSVNDRRDAKAEVAASKEKTLAHRKAAGLPSKGYQGTNRKPERKKEIRSDHAHEPLAPETPPPKNVFKGDFKKPKDPNAQEIILDPEANEFLKNFQTA